VDAKSLAALILRYYSQALLRHLCGRETVEKPQNTALTADPFVI